jgi:hypothetical protein
MNDGKSKLVNTHSHKYYTTRPTVPQQHFHRTVITTHTFINIIQQGPKTLLNKNDHQPTKLPMHIYYTWSDGIKSSGSNIKESAGWSQKI